MDNYTIDPGYKVLSTRSGFYVGRTYTEDGMSGLPYSRNSCYFATYEDAEAHLQKINNGEASPTR